MAPAGAELLFEDRCIHGFSEQESLGAFAAHGTQCVQLFWCFNTLGDNAQSHPVAKSDNTGDETGGSALREA